MARFHASDWRGAIFRGAPAVRLDRRAWACNDGSGRSRNRASTSVQERLRIQERTDERPRGETRMHRCTYRVAQPMSRVGSIQSD